MRTTVVSLPFFLRGLRHCVSRTSRSTSQGRKGLLIPRPVRARTRVSSPLTSDLKDHDLASRSPMLSCREHSRKEQQLRTERHSWEQPRRNRYRRHQRRTRCRRHRSRCPSGTYEASACTASACGSSGTGTSAYASSASSDGSSCRSHRRRHCHKRCRMHRRKRFRRQELHSWAHRPEPACSSGDDGTGVGEDGIRMRYRKHRHKHFRRHRHKRAEPEHSRKEQRCSHRRKHSHRRKQPWPVHSRKAHKRQHRRGPEPHSSGYNQTVQRWHRW